MVCKWILVGCLLLPLLVGGCSDIMDNPSNDPHPPVVSNLVLTPGEIRVGDPVLFTFEYADTGSDITIAHLRDKNSSKEYTLEIGEDPLTGEPINPFPGSSGVCRGQIDKLEGSQQGPHTLVIWLEDAEGSFSGFAEATINVIL